jgi:hypothetical protein
LLRRHRARPDHRIEDGVRRTGTIFWQLGLCRRTWAALTAYGLGGVVGVLPFLVWVAYAQAQHGVSLLAQLGDWYVSGVGGEYDTLSREWYRWWNYLRLPYRGPWVLIVIVSMVASLLWRHPIGVWGLAQTAGHAILFPLFIRKGSPHYLVVLSPWLAALVALWASRLWSRAAPATGALRRRGLQALAIGSVAVTLAVHMAGNLYLLHRYRHANYDGTCARVAQSIEPGSRVYGTLVFWTGLHQYPFLGDVGEWVLPAGEVKDRLRARLVAFRPQYIVRGSDLCWTLAGFGPRQQEFTRDLWRTIDRPRWEALQNLCTDSYLKQHGAVLLDKFETYDFGTIEVHELHW